MSDDDVVVDKPTLGFPIKGEAKKFANKKKQEEKELKQSIKLYHEFKFKIASYQKKRSTLLENMILPTLIKDMKMIHMLDQDKRTDITAKKEALYKYFKDKNEAITFYKKHLQYIK